jgi:hypothetical protein
MTSQRWFLVLLFASCATVPRPGPTGPQAFQALVGRWEGTLEYADYQPPHGRVVLPTLLEVTPSDTGGLRLAFTFDDGPGKTVHSTDRIDFEADGRTLAWGDEGKPPSARPRFTSVTAGRQVVAQTEGSDDDAPATLRETLEVEPGRFTLLKEVRPVGGAFAFRHRYVFTRRP